MPPNGPAIKGGCVPPAGGWRTFCLPGTCFVSYTADARFARRSIAKSGVRVQRPLRICHGWRSKSKKCDEQLTFIVRVSGSFILEAVP
jgi:hypothetical protein